MSPNVQTFQIPGTGPVNYTFDFVFREAGYNNEFGFFPVDSAGHVDGLSPGDPGYLAAALSRARIVFPSGSTASTPDVTIQMDGREFLAFFIIQNSTLANFLPLMRSMTQIEGRPL
jgi:hypothetical protein